MTIKQVPSTNETLIINAEFPTCSSEKLFLYWIEPDLLQQWWPPIAVVEPRLGGNYRLYWPQMNWCLYGQYTDFAPSKRLAFTWQWEHYPVTEEVVVTFKPFAQQGSSMTIEHGPYPDTEQGQEDRQNHLDGWMHFVTKLQTLVESY